MSQKRIQLTLFLPEPDAATMEAIRRQFNPEQYALIRAHITLMHPRNSRCTDAIFAQIEQYALPRNIRLNKISLIEQEPGQPWNVLQEWELGDADRDVQFCG